MKNELSIRCKLRVKYCGQPESGKIVIVGDRPAKGISLTEGRLPFCSNTQSSGWLNAQLVTPEEDLRWINSADINGNATPFDQLYALLPAKVVIALGYNASAWLSIVNVEHLKTYHPQYWKRFRSKERYPLLDILDELIKE
jgi:hypothetical protein